MIIVKSIVTCEELDNTKRRCYWYISQTENGRVPAWSYYRRLTEPST
jgi:hypothetical protein